MAANRLPLRLVLLVVLAVGVAAFVGLAVGTVNGVLELAERLSTLPWYARLPLLVVVAAATAGVGVLVWKLLRPAPRRHPRRDPASLPSRPEVEARVADLRARSAEAASLEDELVELDRRRREGDCHVAVFGEISTGKSSLVRALAPAAATDIDVIGGTTRQVHHFRGELPDGRVLVIADVPGSGEVDGSRREQLARDEALRAHAVVYVAASDLTRAQAAELDWLAGFGKPLVLVLNKVDQYDLRERNALLQRFRERHGARLQAIVAAAAGGLERFERSLPDGRRERVERERAAEVDDVRTALMRLMAGGADALEPAREAAVLARVDERAGELARSIAASESEATVARYTRRAVVGALAAVAPGSDILIQGALGTALVRELARIHDVPVREIDVEALLARLGLSVRNASAIVLAIAGNALKAFPGLGTLGGGLLHAVAYGLVFDSLGRAVALTLAEHARLDQASAEAHVKRLLAEPARERIERVARLALDSLRERDDPLRKD